MQSLLFLLRASPFRVYAPAVTDVVSLSGQPLFEGSPLAGTSTGPGWDRLSKEGQYVLTDCGPGAGTATDEGAVEHRLACRIEQNPGPNASVAPADLPASELEVLLERVRYGICHRRHLQRCAHPGGALSGFSASRDQFILIARRATIFRTLRAIAHRQSLSTFYRRNYQ